MLKLVKKIPVAYIFPLFLERDFSTFKNVPLAPNANFGRIVENARPPRGVSGKQDISVKAFHRWAQLIPDGESQES